MVLQSREKKSEGIAFLIYGDSATGKTPLGLSFPNQILFDSDGGTKFYDEFNENIILESNTLIFKEMLDDLDELENDLDLFKKVETINIDSATRFYENQKHAALKVVEQRALNKGRLPEGEGLSAKEYGVMKLHYDRFIAKLLMMVKLGKNLVYIAESTEETTTKTDFDGKQITTITGIKPNLPKGSKFDFDVIVYTFNKDGKSYGKIEKDRTKSYELGHLIEMPKYSNWQDAIKKSREGKTIERHEIQNFDNMLDIEASNLNTFPSLDKSSQWIQQITDKIQTFDRSSQKNVSEKFKEHFGTAKYKEIKNIEMLEEMYKLLSSME